MSREEFLSQLRNALQGSLTSGEVQENVNYYNEYIIEETRKGKSEEDVLEMLGDPWILAKTITSTHGGNRQSTVYETDERASSAQRNYQTGGTQSQYSDNFQVKVTLLDKWWKKLLLLLFVVMIVMLVIAVISGLVSFFAPLIVPIVIVMIIVRLLGRRR